MLTATLISFSPRHEYIFRIGTYARKFTADRQFEFLEIGMLFQGWQKEKQFPENIVACFLKAPTGR
jgi:hypothetical protein